MTFVWIAERNISTTIHPIKIHFHTTRVRARSNSVTMMCSSVWMVVLEICVNCSKADQMRNVYPCICALHACVSYLCSCTHFIYVSHCYTVVQFCCLFCQTNPVFSSYSWCVLFLHGFIVCLLWLLFANSVCNFTILLSIWSDSSCF